MTGSVTALESGTVDGLENAFQMYGYEGTSLFRLCEETGLIKASLYHRFPDGKQQMAEAALDAALARLSKEVLDVLEDDLPPRDRLDIAIKRIREFYLGGRRSCLLETLTLCGTPKPLTKKAGQAAKLWISTFQRLAKAAGLAPQSARRAAEEGLVQIQGALVVSRLTHSLAPFQRALERLPEILLSPDK